jgi:hypothetical protein
MKLPMLVNRIVAMPKNIVFLLANVQSIWRRLIGLASVLENLGTGIRRSIGMIARPPTKRYPSPREIIAAL